MNGYLGVNRHSNFQDNRPLSEQNPKHLDAIARFLAAFSTRNGRRRLIVVVAWRSLDHSHSVDNCQLSPSSLCQFQVKNRLSVDID
jgi:hypothetical protein